MPRYRSYAVLASLWAIEVAPDPHIFDGIIH